MRQFRFREFSIKKSRVRELESFGVFNICSLISKNLSIFCLINYLLDIELISFLFIINNVSNFILVNNLMSVITLYIFSVINLYMHCFTYSSLVISLRNCIFNC